MRPTLDQYMPEVAATCRVLLRTVGLAACWTDRGPDAQACVWLSTADCPAELTADQWTMLRLSWGLWGEGAFAPLFELRPASLFLLTSFLSAHAAADDACARWSAALSPVVD